MDNGIQTYIGMTSIVSDKEAQLLCYRVKLINGQKNVFIPVNWFKELKDCPRFFCFYTEKVQNNTNNQTKRIASKLYSISFIKVEKVDIVTEYWITWIGKLLKELEDEVLGLLTKVQYKNNKFFEFNPISFVFTKENSKYITKEVKPLELGVMNNDDEDDEFINIINKKNKKRLLKRNLAQSYNIKIKGFLFLVFFVLFSFLFKYYFG